MAQQLILLTNAIEKARYFIQLDQSRVALIVVRNMSFNFIHVFKRNDYHPDDVFRELNKELGKKVSTELNYSEYILRVNPKNAHELLDRVLESFKEEVVIRWLF